MVVASTLACALIAALFCWGTMPDRYTASTSLYVLTKSSNDGISVTNNDLSASQMLTNDVAMLVKGTRVRGDVVDALGLESLSGYDVDVVSSTSTRVITVSVSGSDPELAARIADAVAKATNTVAQEVMEVKSINVINSADVPTSPSGPPRGVYTVAAAVAGFMLSIAVVLVIEKTNGHVRDAEEASELVGLPVIGRIPDMKYQMQGAGA